jgi:DNA polymerase-3 subunit epsilon
VSPRSGRAAAPAFAAIDFETANSRRTSACAVAVVRVEDGRIVARERRLIHPGRGEAFEFEWLHGIGPREVAGAPRFRGAWEEVAPLLEGCAFLAAHNAPFDRSVLDACCRVHRVAFPALPFVCTVRLARRRWEIYPTKLPDVCRRLGIPLRHHDPLSDAEACARIVIAAGAEAIG